MFQVNLPQPNFQQLLCYHSFSSCKSLRPYSLSLLKCVSSAFLKNEVFLINTY